MGQKKKDVYLILYLLGILTTCFEDFWDQNPQLFKYFSWLKTAATLQKFWRLRIHTLMCNIPKLSDKHTPWSKRCNIFKVCQTIGDVIHERVTEW